VYFTEIRDKLLEETDYGQEGQYIETFAQLYGDDERVLMPQWLPDLSSERVLTMSYIDGLHMNEFLAAQPGQERVDHFGQLLWDFIHDQVERRIYTFHADIHPGNFLFRTDGRLGILDYGCVKEFPRDFLDTCVRMLAAHIIDDEEVIRSCYYEIGILERGKERQKYQRELYAFLREFGRFVLKPYKGDAFDFGDGDFRRELNEYIRASMQWRDIRVSKHFIFVNRLLFGLYAMLMQLKPRISTRRSREILLAAANRS
jgi:predicted unusual protein kinase regulating ubiquinone biosynthesis (AarF/ABC1/UbiB family)